MKDTLLFQIEMSEEERAELSRTELSSLIVLLRLLPLKCDIPELAAKLLAMYGSFANVMYAGETAADVVPELTKPAGRTMSLIPNIVACCENTQKMRFKEGYYKSLLPLFLNAMNEECKIIVLDKGNHVTAVHHLANGTDTHATFGLKTVEKIFKELGDNRCIFVHNHPGCSLIPSEEDCIAFEIMNELAEKLNVNLIDCVIFSFRGVYSDAEKKEYKYTKKIKDEIADRAERLKKLLP